ncbi:MAG: ATP-binding protein, partial [Cyclobacteriaceae bacterium]|nr:ATP-binding protein [Cyclobacteriaceae bacterium]
MAFSHFKTRIILRAILLALLQGGLLFFYSKDGISFSSLLFLVITIFSIAELIHFINHTNRKLQQFLEAIKYSDFAVNFSGDNSLGKSFKNLNEAFNEVLEAFRKARSEKEEHWQYLHTVVEHVNTGLFSFDKEGNVGLMNAAAKKLLEVNQLRNIEELIENKSRLYKILFDLPPGKSNLYSSENNSQLSIQATEIRLRGKAFKLVAIQNIQPELQRKEIEAWQNLTKVLRHEIMNSITPIASLTSTLRDILKYEMKKEGDHYCLVPDSANDMDEGLETIHNRSIGLIKFIDAYRDYTNIPLPKITPVNAIKLIENVILLHRTDLREFSIEHTFAPENEELFIQADEELIQQVLINLLKNAIESVRDIPQPNITISITEDAGAVKIEITDNGPGIIREALDKIFIPFYTTKSKGSGIGLALSRQIMQMHHGSLSVRSEPDISTTFTLQF